MAVVRARSSPPYGLFAAVAFAVLATAAAVILGVMWSKAADDHDKMAKALDDQRTATALLNNTITKQSGELADDARLVAQKTADVNEKQAIIDHDKALMASANNNAVRSQNQVTENLRSFDALKASSSDTAQSLRADLAKALAERDAIAKKAEADLSDANQSAEDKRRQLVLDLEDAKSQLAKQNAEIVELRLRIVNEGGKADVAVGEPDGKIIRVNGATGEVYINLGKKDHLTAGMPFTAYDPRLGVRFGTDELALGNGSLEVIQVDQDTAICRITRTTPDRAIQVGDLISNIVYHNDRTRKFHFTVFGDFDLDGDGIATAAERDRLITLIQSWGGIVDDDVTAQTDYLILGAKPSAPLVEDSSDTATTAPATDAAATAAAASGVTGSVSDVRSKDQLRYDTLKIEATSLAIPVLNQNRFLAMVGYYNTTVVRY